MPFMRGMVMSSVTTSGRSAAICSKASTPSRASPATSTSSIFATHFLR